MSYAPIAITLSAAFWLCAAPALAQTSDETPNSAESRIQALEERLADLEERLVALEREGADGDAKAFSFSDTDPVANELCDEPNIVLERVFFRICYNPDWSLANWVGYRLNGELLDGDARRRDNFRPDEELRPTIRAELSDYRRSGYDRGHLAPAAAFKRSDDAMSTTFLLSNIAPQQPNFNRFTWRILEDEVRTLARQSEDIWVFTGNIVPEAPEQGDDTRDRLSGRAGVLIPSHCYKVILALGEDGDIRAYGFVMENTQQRLGSDVTRYARSIDEIEELTGLDFFSYLPDGIETVIESAVSEWPISQ